MTSARYVLEILHRLRSLSPDSLQRLLRARSLPSDSDWPALELAQALAQPKAIASHLEQLTAEELDALRAAEEAEDDGVRRSALDTVLVTARSGELGMAPEVLAVWEELERARRSAVPQTSGPVGGKGQVDVLRVSQYLEWLEIICAASGTVPSESSAADWSARLGEADSALPCAFAAGLVVSRAGRRWLSSWGAWWMGQDLASRWASVAERWWAHSPDWWRFSAHESDRRPPREGLVPMVLSRYPLLSAHRVAEVLDQAEGLGIIDSGALTPVGRALAENTGLADAIDLALPKPIDHVFPDGPDCVIAAGRLDPAVEKTLRRLGTWQSGVLTPRFRITPGSVVSALQEGLSPEAIIDPLRSALPSSSAATMVHDLSYALHSAHSLRLCTKKSFCELSSDDPITLEVIAADYNLTHLAWRKQGEMLMSQRPVGELDHALTEAGYWHVVTDEQGALLPPKTRWECLKASAEDGNAADIDHLAQSLAQQASSPQWWEDSLKLALAHKVSLQVSATVGEEIRVMTVEPMGVANGRLRARDVRAEVERTIPLDQICAIQPG